MKSCLILCKKKGGALIGKAEEKKGSEETNVRKQLDEKKQELMEKETGLVYISKPNNIYILIFL